MEQEIFMIAFDYTDAKQKEFIDRIEKEAKELGMLKGFGNID